jgi:hypothetical protein
MNTELFRNRAGDLREMANGIRSTFDFSLVKEAALKSLADKGVTEEQLGSVLNDLEVQHTPAHAAQMLDHAAEFEKQANILEMSAAAFDELSAKLQSSEDKVAELEKAASVSPTIDVLKSKGQFSDSDLEALKSLPEGTLSKIASANQDPWDLGQATKLSASSVDPILAFVQS